MSLSDASHETVGNEDSTLSDSFEMIVELSDENDESRVLQPENRKNVKYVILDDCEAPKPTKLKVKPKPKPKPKQKVKSDTKGYTLFKAKDTVDVLNRKLGRYKHGFEIPGPIAKKIKQRRISQWSGKNNENDEPPIDVNVMDSHQTVQKTRKRRRNNFIQHISQKCQDKQTKTSVPVEVNTVESQSDTQNLTFWKGKANSISPFLFQYFEIKSQSDDLTRLFVRCKLCPNERGLISCLYGNNSNLKAHLESIHQETFEEVTSSFYLAKSRAVTNSTCQKLSKSELLDEVLRFIIKDNIPVVKVESPHLKRLIEACMGGSFKCDDDRDQNDEDSVNKNKIDPQMKKNRKGLFSSKTAKRRILKLREEHINDLKEEFKSIPYFSATCDIWSRNNRSYIGVNVHYIIESTNELKTVLIACERFHGSHDHKAVAKKLKDIFARYNISKKVVAITTDNAGEFKCAFTRFGKNYDEFANIASEREDDCIWFNDLLMGPENYGDEFEYMRMSDLVDKTGIISSMIDQNAPTDSDFVIHDIVFADSDTEDADGVKLPSQIKCSAHTLNLLGKTDSFNALLDDKYCDIYGEVFTKLNLIWGSSTSSRANSEIVEKYLNRKLLKPHKIRWNRIYDSVTDILSLDRPQLTALCIALNIPSLNDTDYAFLREFRLVMRPIADGLTALEGDIFFGTYLPHLFGIQSHLERLKKQKFKFCDPLVTSIVEGRFNEVMDPYHIRSVPLYLAMITNPKYKLSYMSQLRPTILQKLKNMLLTAAEEVLEETKKEQNTGNVDENAVLFLENEDDEAPLLREFNNTTLLEREFAGSPLITVEIANYLKQPTSKDCDYLDNFPTIKKLYLKYNCISCNEADVERIFSIAGMIFSPRRRQLSDELFETLLMLKVNDY